MDSEDDFLNAEFLYILLFAGKNLLIYPFTYASKLETLKRSLDTVFKIEEFDISNINTLEIFQLYCSNVSSVFPQTDNGVISAKKPLIFFEKGLGVYLSEIKNYPNMQFISLEKSTGGESKNSNIISYNKKLHEFDNFSMDGKSKIEKDAMDYCKFLFSENQLNCSIPIFLNKVIELTQILSDFSVLKYRHFTEVTNEIELAACKLFCEKYFNLNPDAILPDSAILNESIITMDAQPDPDLEFIAKSEHEIEQIEQTTPIRKKSEIPFKASKGKSNPKSTEKSKIKHASESNKQVKPMTKDTDGMEDLDTNQSQEYQYFLELAKLRENPEIYIIFEHQLTCVSVENNTLTTPESKYEFLRKNQWKEGIPFEFLIQLLHQFLLQLAKMNPGKFSGPSSEVTIKEEYEKMLALFMNCDIDDKFTNYTHCREHFKNFFTSDPTAQEPAKIQVLPIYNNSNTLKTQHKEPKKASSNTKKFTTFEDYWERFNQKYSKITAESIKGIIRETTELIENYKKTEV